jgi:hypothetical protein
MPYTIIKDRTKNRASEATEKLSPSLRVDGGKAVGITANPDFFLGPKNIITI